MAKDPTTILTDYWGYSSFRGSQKEVIASVLDQRDVLALLPTGGGKSLCFQIPALVNDGICIVVSPLIALIHDQVETLKNKGIKAIALTGGISFEEVNNLLDNCIYGNYKFLYLSPERLQQEIVRTRIQQMNVNLIAIDEAHCISQWGHDFRPAYLECSKLRELIPETPMIALTATATKRVAQDIVENLKFNSPLIFNDSFARKNIAFSVLWEQDKRYRLKQICASAKSSIVYVRTRRAAQDLAAYLNSNGVMASFFHGGLSKGEKQDRLKRWLSNELRTMVATNAFGMGIDKPDVALVVHYHIPDCIENYFQEAGRAGRNGEASRAVLLTNKRDEAQVKDQFLSVLPDIPFIKLVYNKLNNYLQISYGEKSTEHYQLNFNAFCATYKLQPLIAYNAFKILDQNSVFALSEEFSKKTTVQFLSTKEHLFGYLEKNRNLVQTVQTILRTYGGIFEFETKINTFLVAKKAEVPETFVFKVLKQLQTDEIIAYQERNSDLELTFLVPREDDRTIHPFAKKVKALNKIKIKNIDSILRYINTDTLCRSRQLLNYFGEKVETDCGKCDICLADSSQRSHSIEIIMDEIVRALDGKGKTSRQLITALSYDEKAILLAIGNLLEIGKIKINTKNEYELG